MFFSLQLLMAHMFDTIFSTFDVTESDDIEEQMLEVRMKVLQNELFNSFCVAGDHLPYSSLLAIDKTIESEEQSLMESCVVRAKEKSDPAERILNRFTMPESANLSELEVIIGNILRNKMWSPSEIITFLQKATRSTQGQITDVLETVLTYKLSSDSALRALRKAEPLAYLHLQVEREKDKDVNTLVHEMRTENYPEGVVTIIEEVLRYVECELPKISTSMRLRAGRICAVKRMVQSMDFQNPDIDCLQELCLAMSLAVKKCTSTRRRLHIRNEWHDMKDQGYFPRITQLASVLLLLLPQMRGEKGCLLEIATGEGKTCIIAMFAAVQAIRGLKPDIVTSSPVLAKRDRDQWCDLYSMFDLTSAVLRNEDREYYKDIVYGTVTEFAGDILRQEFEGRRTRGARECDMVIVDEVDHMTLDNGDSTTYLSDDDSSLIHMEQVLAGIWVMVSACRQIEMLKTGEIYWITAPQLFHSAAMSAFGISESEHFSAIDILQSGVTLGLYSQQMIDELVQAEHKMEADEGAHDAKEKALEKIMAVMGPCEQYELLREFEITMGEGDLIEYFSVFKGKAAMYGDIVCPDSSEDKVRLLLLEKGCVSQIVPQDVLISRTVDNLKSKIKYSDQCDPKNIEKIKEFIVIPAFLKEYTEHNLHLFVEKALTAIVMAEGREYMIEKSRQGEEKDESDSDVHQYDAIIPVDLSNGVLEKNRSWLGGLQQFLEIKHKLAISPLTIMTNYMSNIHYFQRYLSGEGVFGVTGTLGGEAEKAFLYRHYETKSYVVPTHRHKKVVELPAVQVTGGKEKWIHKICETAWSAADRAQVVLVICEDIKTANDIHSEMKTEEKYPITMYTVSGRHEIEKHTFSGRDIIIATNLAGRGTDIEVQPEVNIHGGLFVLLTYFPKSQRMEKQVFGRTARKGNPGRVQMVLDQEKLEPYYQGQSADIMRKFREQRELSYIQYMEGVELHVIHSKRKLFSTFCDFLDDFRTNYRFKERTEINKMAINDVPECFKSYRHKFDYHPAVAALKQSWALWLTQHDQHIRKAKADKDIKMLKEDLREELKQKSKSLLKGKSKNFHDHIEQASSRTDLHRLKKKKSFGAKAYWQNAAECDKLYSAVALYNKAYVAINLREEGYKAEAENILKEAQDLVDVFLMETTNTMIFCNLAGPYFRAHHENTNLLMQMQTRMNIFQFWKNYMENALDMLREVKDKGDYIIAEESSMTCLLEEKDFITRNELVKMNQYGLKFVFNIRKKPQFCYDALICVFIGVLQVVTGALILAFTGGAATNFGLGLISEGVSDMISGVIGMISGEFSWAEWAVSKSISVGISLLCGGINVLSKGLTSAGIGAKAITSGAKSVTAIAAKQAVTQAAKYTVQELAKQGVLSAVNYAMDEGFKSAFETIFSSAFKHKVSKLIRSNQDLDEGLTQFICQVVPVEAVGTQDYKIASKYKQRLDQSVTYMTTQAIPELVTDLTNIRKVISVLTQVSNSAMRVLEKHGKSSRMLSVVSKIFCAGEYTTSVIQMLKAIPTKSIINDQLVPQLLEQMKQEEFIPDGREELKAVKRLKEKFVCRIADSVSEALVDAMVAHMTSIASRATGSMVNHNIGRCVENVLGRHETMSFFDDQKKNHKMTQASKVPPEHLTMSERSELLHYAKGLSGHEKPATGIDLHVLTNSDLLKGRGIRVIITDEKGTPLYEERYRGKDKLAGDITLRLVKEKDTSKQ